MNTEPENFEALQKLLKIKKHEQPPPGYFNELPRKVWMRIEQEESRGSFWNRWFQAFGLKPSVAYAFGLIICGTLIVSIGSALKTAPESTASHSLPQNESFTSVPLSPPAISKIGAFPEQEFTPTNPVTSGEPLYPGMKLRVEPVSFNP